MARIRLLAVIPVAVLIPLAPISLWGEQLPSPSDLFRPLHGEQLSPVAPSHPLGSASLANSRRVSRTAYMQGPSFGMPEMGSSAGAAGPAPPALQASPPARVVPETPPSSYPSLGSGNTPAPSTATPMPPGLTPVPSSGTRSNPLVGGAAPAVISPSDLAPVTQPRLDTEWSTADNCNLVSPPSGYRAEFWNCGPSYIVPAGAPAYGAPQTIVPPTVMPGAVVAAPPYLDTPGHRPLFTLGQEYYNVQLGQGIIGQPTAYVPGQNIRNFIRYLSP